MTLIQTWSHHLLANLLSECVQVEGSVCFVETQQGKNVMQIEDNVYSSANVTLTYLQCYNVFSYNIFFMLLYIFFLISIKI